MNVKKNSTITNPLTLYQSKYYLKPYQNQHPTFNIQNSSLGTKIDKQCLQCKGKMMNIQSMIDKQQVATKRSSGRNKTLGFQCLLLYPCSLKNIVTMITQSYIQNTHSKIRQNETYEFRFHYGMDIIQVFYQSCYSVKTIKFSSIKRDPPSGTI